MDYKYFDTPDGEDCFKKLLISTKYGAALGLFSSALDVMTISHPKGYAATISRFGHITIPFIGVAATFTSTSCLLATIRKKDDHLNYLISGAACGGIIGVWQKSVSFGSALAVILGVMGAVYKDCLIHNWSFINPTARSSFGDFWTIRYDYSLVKERPRSWVKE